MCAREEDKKYLNSFHFISLINLIKYNNFLYRSFHFSLQLYEINNDPKRKEFLDDLFTFMKDRGKKSSHLIFK